MEGIPLLETHMAVHEPLQSCKCLWFDFLFGWILLQCWRVLLTPAICVFVLWDRCREALACPRRKSRRCRVSRGYIPSFHFGSVHLLALLACIHMHLFTNRNFCSCFGGLSDVMSTILHFAVCVSAYRLDWGYVLSHHWKGLSTVQQYFITGVAVTGCEGYRSFYSVPYCFNYALGTFPPMHHNLLTLPFAFVVGHEMLQ